VIYQIYPRSFRDLNGDGIGDLAGITAALPYVASLGVDGVWLSPFFRSPMRDFGYDVSDYRDVDPCFGTLADFDALLARAHGLGLKVIIDQVYSHTSSDHPWFVESAGVAGSDKADWYVWAPAKPDGSPPNNWRSTFDGPAWSWSPARRMYYLHNFLPSQPDLNFHHAPVRQAMLEVARFWLERGVDGFRLDVINYVAHDPALTDNPPVDGARTPARTYLFQRHLHEKSQPQALAFAEQLRALTDRYPDRMMVGEIFDDNELALQRAFTEGQGRLHTAYSFHLLAERRADPGLFTAALEAWIGASGWPSWSIGNHDVPRYPTRLGGPGAGDAQVKALLAALFSLRGTLFLYQGDELGLPQGRVAFEDLRDPFARAAFTGDAGRDGARTPFPWDAAAPMAGFTEADAAWLPLDPAHAARAVSVQQTDEGSVLAFTRRLIALRRASPALRLGEAAVWDAPPGVLAVERGDGAARVLCVVNLEGEPAALRDARLAGGTVMLTEGGATLGDDSLTLGGFAIALVAYSDWAGDTSPTGEGNLGQSSPYAEPHKD
jgi:alpha-glucosidase